MQWVLAAWESVFGPEYFFVATSLDSLAEFYEEQSKYDEAEQFYRRELATWENVVGMEHRRVARTLEKCATLLRKMGREPEAEKMETGAQAMRAKQTKEK